MSFDFREFRKFAKKIEKMDKEWDKFISGFLLEMGLRVLTRTKKNTPVDTGLLRNSWQLGNVQRNGDKVEITIYNPTDYATYVEYGHMNRRRNGWIEGRFMCTIAIDEIERELPSRFNKAFLEWIKSIGM